MGIYSRDSLTVFPARVGMNRRRELPIQETTSVPRASGDEPQAGGGGREEEVCSPREWG